MSGEAPRVGPAGRPSPEVSRSWATPDLPLSTVPDPSQAGRAFDEAHRRGAVARDGAWLDVLTNLIESAAVLGDRDRAVRAHRMLDRAAGRLAVVGPAVVCKGSLERYRALGPAAAG